MKNVVICGLPRCGKSTLANMIADKYNYQIIRMDALRSAFEKAFPELNINPSTAKSNQKYLKFVQQFFIESAEKEPRNKYNYVLEGVDIEIKDLKKLFNRENTVIIYLLPLSISPEDFYKDIREHDTQNDWSSKRSNKNLMKVAEYEVLKARELYEECIKYGVNYIDVGTRRNKKLKYAIKTLGELIK